MHSLTECEGWSREFKMPKELEMEDNYIFWPYYPLYGKKNSAEPCRSSFPSRWHSKDLRPETALLLEGSNSCLGGAKDWAGGTGWKTDLGVIFGNPLLSQIFFLCHEAKWSGTWFFLNLSKSQKQSLNPKSLEDSCYTGPDLNIIIYRKSPLHWGYRLRK